MPVRHRILALISAVICASGAQEIARGNCYPSGVKITGSTATTVTVRYFLNENADGNGGSPGLTIRIRRASDNVAVRTVTFTAPVTETRKGVHTYTWDKKDDSNVTVPAANYYFDITALDNGYGAWTLISVDDTSPGLLNSFELPRGVAVNKNVPDHAQGGNEFFGRVYVSVGRVGTTATGRTVSDGVYILNADFSVTDVPGGSAVKTGGVAWDTSFSISPWRIQVGPDNQVYITDDLDAHTGFWAADADFAVASFAFDNAGVDGTGLNGVHGNVLDMYITGTGANRKIFTIDEDFQGPGGDATTPGSIWEYDIGTQAVTSTPPTIVYDDRVAGNKILSQAQDYDCIDFGNGSFWITGQLAGTNGQALPSLMEISPAGAILWASVPALAADSQADPLKNARGLAYTEDIAAGGTHKYVAVAREVSGSNISVVDILASPRTVTSFAFAGGGGTSTNNECASDAAGNLYVVNQTAEYCRVWSPPTGVNSFSTQSANFSTAGPVINTPPQSQTVCNGAPVTFTVNASGTGTLSYQWYRNSVALGSPMCSGQTSCSLNLTAGNPDAQSGDVYRVDVSNANGTTSSSNATLTIDALVKTHDPYHQTVNPGATAVFTIGVTSNLPGSLTHQWFKSPSTPVGTNSATLTLTNVGAGDAGTYYVHVADTCANFDSAPAILTVLSLPCADPFADAAPPLGVVDLNDFGAWQRCYTGPGGAGFDAALCSCFDRDDDGNVDADDLTAFENCADVAGHPKPVDPNCDGSAVAPFSDNFNTNTAGDWTVNITSGSNSFAEFNYDYSVLGIPSAPHSAGDTHGLRLRANTTGSVGGGVSVSPTGKHFPGNFTVQFDAWLNYNPPVNYGGSGSTMYTIWGALTSGTTVNSILVADAIFLAVDGDAGWSGSPTNFDYRVLAPGHIGNGYPNDDAVFAANQHTAGETVGDAAHPYYAQFFGGTVENVHAPAAEIAHFPTAGWGGAGDITGTGCLGYKWRDVGIVKNGKWVVFYIDGHLIATVDKTGLTLGGDNIVIGQSDFDAVSSGDANAPEMIFGLIDNLTVTPN